MRSRFLTLSEIKALEDFFPNFIPVVAKVESPTSGPTNGPTWDFFALEPPSSPLLNWYRHTALDMSIYCWKFPQGAINQMEFYVKGWRFLLSFDGNFYLFLVYSWMIRFQAKTFRIDFVRDVMWGCLREEKFLKNVTFVSCICFLSTTWVSWLMFK